jgi:DNA-directed RNA polymerase omega subunit
MPFTIVTNKYSKVLVAAQRAKQIEKGARPRIQTQNLRAVGIALEEVERGLVGYDFIVTPKEGE